MTRRKTTRVSRNRRKSRRMEDALRESEGKYRAIVENSPNMVGVLQDGVLKYANLFATERIGWTFDELVSRTFNPIEKVVAERFRSLIKENVGRRLRGDNVPPYEISLIAKNGSEIPVIVRAAKISYEGKPAVQFSFADITDRHKYEARLLGLHRHGSQLSSARDVDTIVKDTLDAMAFTLGFDHAYFLLVEGNSLRIKGGRGEPVAFSAQPLNGPGVTVKAANTRTTIRIPDTTKEPAFVDPKGYDWKGPPTVLSELVVPVLIGHEAAAVLCVDSNRLDSFTDDDKILLETLAIHVGSELKRLRREEELETVARFPSENPSPVFRLNRDGRILFANEACGALLQQWGTTVGGSSPKFWADLAIQLLSNQSSKTVDVDLGERVYSIYLVPVVSAGYINAYGRDVTERKKNEEALRISEERYGSLFKSMLEGFAHCKMIFDDSGRPADFVYLDVNAAFSRLTGLEDVVGKKVTEVIPGIKEENPELFEIYGRVSMTGKPERFEIDLESLGISLAISVYSPMKGNFVAVFENITERKRMEEKLRSLHEHALGLASATKMDEIVNYTLDTMQFTLGFDHADFSLVEEGMLAVKGCRGDMPSFSVKLDGPGVVARAAREKTSVLVYDTRKESNYFDRKGPDWKGPPTMLSELATPVMIGGQTVAVLNVDHMQPNAFTKQDQRLLENLAAHVASEMKRLAHEAQLAEYSKHLEALVEERTAKLRQVESLAAIGETAAMVGHDLRNPLQGIAGASYNIRRNLRNPVDTSTTEMLAVIDNGVAYANGIINDLLDFSREAQLQRLPTTPSSIVRGAFADIRVPSSVEVENETADVPEILADEPKLIRVLANLIENAIDAMPQGGKLSVSSSGLEKEVSISVTDTGVGIPQEQKNKIWKPLYTTKAKGIGLGLSICKRIVEAHGGSIWMESVVGEGTTFTLKLPIGPHGGGERA